MYMDLSPKPSQRIKTTANAALSNASCNVCSWIRLEQLLFYSLHKPINLACVSKSETAVRTFSKLPIEITLPLSK